MEKKRVIKSLENLDSDLKALLKKNYPDGFEGHLMRLQNAKKEPFFVVPLETSDTMYLVKIAVTKNSDGEYDIDEEENDMGDDDENISNQSYDEDFDDD
ncbi:MAG: hypothetical protein RLO81_14775 [Fulvivirga sp.]|uniref:hypothetical protein n=1 Tax=Fulvivirga sp. TaxID=1931237 RepID=UPI0032EB1411